MARNILTRKQWAERLNGQWQQMLARTFEAIFALGRDLITAKAELPHGEFEVLVQSNLHFTPRTARRVMAIARDSRLVNRTHVSVLPPHWGTLYLISRLGSDDFDRFIGDGTINPEMERNDIAKVLRLAKVSEDEKRIFSLVPAVGKFRTVVLDPAWEYDWLSLAGRAKPGYAMQTGEQLEALDVSGWADDALGCHLYLWTTNNFMRNACALVKHWRFDHRTVITWIKPPPFGLGSYFRNSTEHVLFATRGATTTRHAAASIATHFEAPRGEHSEKPEHFYNIVRAASYPPYGEGNQRTPRPDFTNLFVEADTEAAE